MQKSMSLKYEPSSEPLLVRVVGHRLHREERGLWGETTPRDRSVRGSLETSPSHASLVLGGLVCKAHRLLYHSTLGRDLSPTLCSRRPHGNGCGVGTGPHSVSLSLPHSLSLSSMGNGAAYPYLYLYISIYLYLYLYIYLYLYLSIYIYIYIVFMYIYVAKGADWWRGPTRIWSLCGNHKERVLTYMYMCIYVYVCSYIFMCIYVDLYIYIYTYIFIYTLR